MLYSRPAIGSTVIVAVVLIQLITVAVYVGTAGGTADGAMFITTVFVQPPALRTVMVRFPEVSPVITLLVLKFIPSVLNSRPVLALGYG